MIIYLIDFLKVLPMLSNILVGKNLQIFRETLLEGLDTVTLFLTRENALKKLFETTFNSLHNYSLSLDTLLNICLHPC